MIRIFLFLVSIVLLNPVVVYSAPAEFTLPDVNGKYHKLSDYYGKWLVVNYWATWCPPCLEEMSELTMFHDIHKDRDAIVIGVNFEEIDTNKLKLFIKDYSINYLVLRTNPSKISDLGAMPAIPITFVINPRGEIVAKLIGPTTIDKIELVIKNNTLAYVRQ